MVPHVGGHDVAQGVEVAGVGEVVQPPVTARHVLHHGDTGAGGDNAQPTLSMRWRFRLKLSISSYKQAYHTVRNDWKKDGRSAKNRELRRGDGR